MDEIIKCLDLAYHELRYVYDKQTVFTSEVIKSNLTTELRVKYNKDPEFRNRLNSVLKYAVMYGEKIEQYFNGKIKNLPKINGRPLSSSDLELIIGLEKAAILGESRCEY